MENNAPLPPPPFPLLFYPYDGPYDPHGYVFLPLSFPINITVYDFSIPGIDLYFTITNHSVTITPIDEAQHLHLFPHHNEEEDNNNNEAEEDLHLFPHQNGAADLDPLPHQNGAAPYNINGAEEDLHILPDENGADDNNEAEEDLDLVLDENEAPDDDYYNGEVAQLYQFAPDYNGLRQHGLTLSTLPTLPAYIHISNHHKTFLLLVNPDETIFIVDPPPPLPVPLSPPHNGGDNHQVINHPITFPFILTLFFANVDDNTTITVFIRVSAHNIIIQAGSQIGTTYWVAHLSVPAPEA